MHLTLVISSLNSGGAERVLSELANHWASQGHQVSLVTLAYPESKPFYSLDPNIYLIQLNQSQNETFLFVRLRSILRRVFCLRKTFKALKPNVIISFLDIMNLTTLLATMGLKIPVIVSERSHPAYHQLPLLYQKARALLYPKAFQVVMQTGSAAGYFKKLTNLMVIPNAVVQPLNRKMGVSKTVKRIVSVGRLCLFKGFDTLIYAFFRLHRTYPHLQLTIYGEGHERDNLENLIRQLGLQEKVFFPGAIKDIQQALLHADLFVFPSHYEGFPNALCEAMSIGLPVIASNCSGNVDIIRDRVDGRFFPIGDVEVLVRVMEELLNDQDQRTRLAQNAKTISERFHPDPILRQWDNLILKAKA